MTFKEAPTMLTMATTGTVIYTTKCLKPVIFMQLLYKVLHTYLWDGTAYSV